MSNYYTVKALDNHESVTAYDSNEIYSIEVEGKGVAIGRAKDMMKEHDLIETGLHTVQVIDDEGEVVWDDQI